MFVDVDVTGLDGFEDRMEGVARRAADPRRALRSVADHFAEVERAQFRTRGAARSGGWDPNAEATIRQKGNDLVGRDTDRLYKSLTQKKPAGGRRVFTRTGMVFGSTVPHARLFARRRPLVKPNEHDENEVRRILADFILRGRA